MDEQAVDALYEQITNVIDGKDYDTVMIVLGALHNTLALQHTLDETRIRQLYTMMADAAVCMAMLEQDGNDELQATENPPQKKTRKKARKAPRDEPGPFGLH